MSEPQTTAHWTVDRAEMTDLVIDLWRIRRRAQRQNETPESVRVACEVAMDRLAGLGFEVRELVGELYDENMRVRVVDQEGGETNLRISECLTPAVYRDGLLVRQAEVIVAGD